MITVLVVGEASGFEEAAAPDGAVEVVHARDAEEAVEKLGRNRRIDAVLLAGLADPCGVVDEIRADNPSPPTLFATAGASCPGAETLPPGDPKSVLALILRTLSA